MAKKQALPETEQSEATLTKDIQQGIEDIIIKKKKIALAQEDLKSMIEGVATKLGIKKNTLTERISMIIAEEEKGGILKTKSDNIDFVEKYFNIKDQE